MKSRTRNRKRGNSTLIAAITIVFVVVVTAFQTKTILLLVWFI